MASLTWDIEESFYWVFFKGLPPALTINPRQAGVASCVQGHLSPRNPVNGDVLQQRFWWSTLEEDNQDFVEVCHIYHQHKPKHQAPAGLLWPPPVPPVPWSHILKKLDHPPAVCGPLHQKQQPTARSMIRTIWLAKGFCSPSRTFHSKWNRRSLLLSSSALSPSRNLHADRSQLSCLKG